MNIRNVGFKGSHRSVRARCGVESLEERRLFAVAFDTYLLQPSDNLRPIATAADRDGNAYVMGSFTGVVDFNPRTFRRYNIDGGSDASNPTYFVAKYSPKGDLYYAIPFFPSDGPVDYQGIATDNSGNFYISGVLTGQVDADPGRRVRTRAPSSGADVIVSKFNPLGAFLGSATQTTGGDDVTSAGQIRVDASGSTYVAGTFSGGTTGYLARFSSSGKALWWNDFRDNSSIALGLDRNGAPAVAAQTPTNASMEIVRFNGSGRFLSNQILTTAASATGSVTPASLDFDAANNPVIAGDLVGTADFNATSTDYILRPKLVGDTLSNIFLSKYTPAGKLVFASLTGNTGDDHAAGAYVDRDTNDIFLTGSFNGVVDFDPSKSGTFLIYTEHDNSGSDAKADLFVSKFSPSGAFLNAASAQQFLTDDEAVSFAVAPGDRLFVLGDSVGLDGTKHGVSMFLTVR